MITPSIRFIESERLEIMTIWTELYDNDSNRIYGTDLNTTYYKFIQLLHTNGIESNNDSDNILVIFKGNWDSFDELVKIINLVANFISDNKVPKYYGNSGLFKCRGLYYGKGIINIDEEANEINIVY